MGKIIARGVIERVNELYDELDVLSKDASEEFKKAKLNRENLILINRGDKQEEITEGTAWEEIRIMGEHADPYKFMAEKYPEVFAKSNKHLTKVKEVDNYVMEHLGISFSKITVRDIINLVESIIDMKK